MARKDVSLLDPCALCSNVENQSPLLLSAALATLLATYPLNHYSKMSHPRCVYINNRCGYQSITQQYLKKKRCLIKNEVNYIFRPNVAIIRFTSESMVVLLYGIGMDMSRWWDLSVCDVCYMLFIWAQGGGICNLRYPAGAALVFLLASVLCGFPVTVFPYPISISGGLLLWVLWRGERTKE